MIKRRKFTRPELSKVEQRIENDRIRRLKALRRNRAREKTLLKSVVDEQAETP